MGECHMVTKPSAWRRAAATIRATRRRNRPNRIHSASSPAPPASASHCHRSVAFAQRRGEFRNTAARFRGDIPLGFPKLRQRQRVDIFAICRPGPAPCRAVPLKNSSDLAAQREGRGIAVFAHHAHIRPAAHPHRAAPSPCPRCRPSIPSAGKSRAPSSAAGWRIAAAWTAHSAWPKARDESPTPRSWACRDAPRLRGPRPPRRSSDRRARLRRPKRIPGVSLWRAGRRPADGPVSQ